MPRCAGPPFGDARSRGVHDLPSTVACALCGHARSQRQDLLPRRCADTRRRYYSRPGTRVDPRAVEGSRDGRTFAGGDRVAPDPPRRDRGRARPDRRRRHGDGHVHRRVRRRQHGLQPLPRTVPRRRGSAGGRGDRDDDDGLRPRAERRRARLHGRARGRRHLRRRGRHARPGRRERPRSSCGCAPCRRSSSGGRAGSPP